MQKAFRNLEHAPGSVISENAADLALKRDGAASELGVEFGGKRSEAFIADFETDIGDSALGCEHLAGALHAEASEKVVRGLAECGAEKAMEVKFGEACLARRMREEDAGAIFGRNQITAAAQAAESIVIEQGRHKSKSYDTRRREKPPNGVHLRTEFLEDGHQSRAGARRRKCM